MSEGTIGESRGGRLNRAVTAAENMALAAGAGAPGVADDDPAPWQGAAADHPGDRVGNALFGSPHDLLGQIGISKLGCIFGEPHGFLRHDVRPPRLTVGCRDETLQQRGHAKPRNTREVLPWLPNAWSVQPEAPCGGQARTYIACVINAIMKWVL